ncbi:maker362 [Drosophila busckii]|uniref:Maker362 n=1 Tax=Drosophila busckii TaxID=30019 RepID=A0A0M3QZT0_DROBS|nr:chromodomain-helicase-DNA-binding protein 1 [Drosophila busckii]ALC49919.1 maker362 [Drosophila busckii]
MSTEQESNLTSTTAAQEEEATLETACVQMMLPVRKAIRKYYKVSGEDTSPEAQKTEKLLKIGQHIAECSLSYADLPERKKLKKNLWKYVAKKLVTDAKQLKKSYKHEMRKQARKQRRDEERKAQSAKLVAANCSRTVEPKQPTAGEAQAAAHAAYVAMVNNSNLHNRVRPYVDERGREHPNYPPGMQPRFYSPLRIPDMRFFKNGNNSRENFGF